MESFAIRSYLDAVTRLNNLPISDTREWFFHHGMLFRSRAKWWADFGTRHATHEGLDIARFRNRAGRVQWLDTKTRVPAMAGGEVINVCGDFLGRSVIVKHARDEVSRLVSVYSHITVPSGIMPGIRVEKGDVIGQIADTTGKKSGIHCHLHISIMEIANHIPDRDITWEIMGEPDLKGVKLYNPMVW
ncbi:MAG: M23 family metallopeptidase [Desulfobacteraceae bacterium]|nr:M23 family metallopeptidase [Desulfobacteraceae bacterium]